jgi:acyl transferase domain-containing protein
MLVLKERKENVEQLMKEAFSGTNHWLDYAAENAADKTVLAGSEDSVKYFAEFCKNNGRKTHVLDATHAFHSRDMDPILEEYRKIASTVNHMKATSEFVSGRMDVLGKRKTMSIRTSGSVIHEIEFGFRKPAEPSWEEGV